MLHIRYLKGTGTSLNPGVSIFVCERGHFYPSKNRFKSANLFLLFLFNLYLLLLFKARVKPKCACSVCLCLCVCLCVCLSQEQKAFLGGGGVFVAFNLRIF